MNEYLVPASSQDRAQICALLARAFDQNSSANDAVLQDSKRERRILHLMEYAFDTGIRRNGVFKTSDGNGAFILFNPKEFPIRLADIISQIRLIHRAVGWSRLKYMLRKDKMLRSFHPTEPFLYLFFIGTNPEAQGTGCGSRMMQAIQEIAKKDKLPVVLETSVPMNVTFYEKRGYRTFAQWLIRENYLLHYMRLDA